MTHTGHHATSTALEA